MNNPHVILNQKGDEIVIQVHDSDESVVVKINPFDYDYENQKVSIGVNLKDGSEFTVVKDLSLFIKSVNLEP